jgi:DNA-binding LacI/PurR family transcriptional regulator
MKYLKSKNKKIPSEVQIIGFDNSFIGELLSPSLTTIHQPIKELGALAVELLVKQINGEDVPIENHFIETRLKIRESTL